MSFAAVVERLSKLENPYPGLRPFDTQESHLFFGRDQQVAELVSRLERNRFVAVVGVSGSGKSSLVRAGLIPALERSHLSEAGRRWRMVVTRPAGAPFARLAEDLAKAGLDPSKLEESSHGLIEVARQLPSDESLLVVVDQFEELFRYKDLTSAVSEGRRKHDASAAEAAEFVQLLLAASRHQPPVYIVLTMRSDYLGDCAEFRDLPETLNDCQYLVPRMTREQRKEAIEGPLGRVEMEPSLVQRLLNDAGDEPDQLPVLQHALMRTWNRWRREDPDRKRRIQLQDYEATGGLEAALDQHADELLAGVSVELTATIFKRLTARGRSSRERRNPATLAELCAVCSTDSPEPQAQVTAIVDHFRLGEATFLVPRDGELHAGTYIDITHESLIRQWKKLRDEWLPKEQASVKTFLELFDRARNWKKKRGELLIGLDLSDALEWDKQRNKSPAWAQHYAPESALQTVLNFIRASESKRRFRAWLTLGAAVVLVGAGLGFIYQQRAAQIAREVASEARIRSLSSLRDPLMSALLLAELGDRANEGLLAVYQETAAAAIPFAVLNYPNDELAVGAGFLSDGRAAVASQGGSLWAWRSDGRDDPTVRVLVARSAPSPDPAATAAVSVAAFSRDGRRIAAGLTTGAVTVGRSDGGVQSPQITGADSTSSRIIPPVSALAFSRDGGQLAAGYSDTTTRIWRLDAANNFELKATPIELPRLHNGPISSLDFDPTGRRVATGSWDGTIRIWNLDDRALGSVALGGGTNRVKCVVFSPDGTLILGGYDSGDVRVWRSDRVGTTEVSLDLRLTGSITAAAFSPKGSKLVIASDDRTARIWTVRSLESSDDRQTSELRVIDSPILLAHDALVTAVAFNSDGSKILTTSEDGRARLWPSEPGEPRILGLHDGRVESVVFSPDGKYILSASTDRTARIWSLDGKSKPQILAGHNDWVRSAVFSPADAQKVLTASDDGTLRLWDLTEPGKSRLSQEASTVFEAAFDRSGGRVVTAVKDKTARLWKTSGLVRGGSALDPLGQSEIVELHHKDWVLGAAFSSDGSKIVTASRDGTVSIWMPERNPREPVNSFALPRRPTVFSAVFSPDGTRIVTASEDGVARVWTIDGKEVMALRHTEEVTKALFSTRGEWIVTASKDGTARLWSSGDGSERVVLQHGTESVRAVAFDGADTRIVTGTAEGVIRLWRITVSALKEYLSGATTACLTPTDHFQYLGESEDQAWSHYEACERGYGRTPVPWLRPSRSSPGSH